MPSTAFTSLYSGEKSDFTRGKKPVAFFSTKNVFERSRTVTEDSIGFGVTILYSRQFRDEPHFFFDADVHFRRAFFEDFFHERGVSFKRFVAVANGLERFEENFEKFRFRVAVSIAGSFRKLFGHSGEIVSGVAKIFARA